MRVRPMVTGLGAAARAVHCRDVLTARALRTANIGPPRGSAFGNLRRAADLTGAVTSCHSGHRPGLIDAGAAVMRRAEEGRERGALRVSAYAVGRLNGEPASAPSAWCVFRGKSGRQA